jgi:hypothetical protein
MYSRNGQVGDPHNEINKRLAEVALPLVGSSLSVKTIVKLELRAAVIATRET